MLVLTKCDLLEDAPLPAGLRDEPFAAIGFLAAVLRQDIAWADAHPVGKVQSILTSLDSTTVAMGDKLSEAVMFSVQFFAGIGGCREATPPSIYPYSD